MSREHPSELPKGIPYKGDTGDDKEPTRPEAHAGKLGAQLKTDIGIIMGQVTKSDLRSLMSRYLRCVSPHFMNDEDSNFPRSVRPSPHDHSKSIAPGEGNVLLFHVGNAILSYYQVLKDDFDKDDLRTIQLVHTIAVIGVNNFRVCGTADRGYNLFRIDAGSLAKIIEDKDGQTI